MKQQFSHDVYSCLYHFRASDPFLAPYRLQEEVQTPEECTKGLSLPGSHLCLLLIHSVTLSSAVTGLMTPLQFSQQPDDFERPYLLYSLFLLRKPHPSLINPPLTSSPLRMYPHYSGTNSKPPFRVHLLQETFSDSTFYTDAPPLCSHNTLRLFQPEPELDCVAISYLLPKLSHGHLTCTSSFSAAL